MSDEDSGADEPERTPAERLRAGLAIVKQPRVLAVLVAVGLLWLGVWTYTSGSSASITSKGGVGTVSTLSAPPTTVPHASRAAKRKNKKKKAAVSTTVPAPPPGLAKTPQAYATALFDDWVTRDRADALRVADAAAVKQLFVRHSRHGDAWVAKGCVAAGSTSACTWSSGARTLVLTVRNPTASTPVRVVGASLTP